MMATRTYCVKCQFPSPACICSSVSEVKCWTQFHILQHPNEAKAAKNTAHLVHLCIPEAQMWLGESYDDFSALRKHLQSTNDCAILYPSEQALTISEKHTLPKQLSPPLQGRHILLIDATWRKAYKMWQLNTWLHELTALKFSDIDSLYRIRKSSVKNALSTLECVFHYLNAVEPEVDGTPLLNIFEARQRCLSPPSNKAL